MVMMDTKMIRLFALYNLLLGGTSAIAMRSSSQPVVDLTHSMGNILAREAITVMLDDHLKVINVSVYGLISAAICFVCVSVGSLRPGYDFKLQDEVHLEANNTYSTVYKTFIVPSGAY
jgi:hypothetical protein